MNKSKQQELPELSPKSTKAQIMEAYKEVVSKLKDNQTVSPEQIKDQADKKTLLAEVTKLSTPGILEDLSKLKITMGSELDNLSSQLTHEYDKLQDIQNSIRIESSHLEELYGIKDNASSLSAMLITQTEQRQKYESEMAHRKAQLIQEMNEQEATCRTKISELEAQYQHKADALKTERSRENEEYAYRTKLERQKNKDDYEQRKAVLELELKSKVRSLEEREAHLSSQEEEVAKLKAEIESFPAKLDKECKDTETKVSKSLQAQYDFDTKLRESDFTGKIQLQEQTIKSYQEKITDQSNQIKQLTAKIDLLSKQMESIANRALDTSVKRIYNQTEKTNNNQG